MKLSDSIEDFIRDLLNAEDSVELKRNELASTFHCVPSQINYVIATRFTTERGYMVESRRGGGGYIRITRVPVGNPNRVMHIVNSIGDHLDVMTMEALVKNMFDNEWISQREAKLIMAACSDSSLSVIRDGSARNMIRARLFKNILVNLV